MAEIYVYNLIYTG